MGTVTTSYGALVRLYTNKNPNLKCINTKDLFTHTSSNKGNKVLAYPIGLITADEVSFAGGVYQVENLNFYLKTGKSFHTMSPWVFNNTAGRFYVSTDGKLGNGGVNTTSYDVRPVININPYVTLKGSGTTTSPYEIEGAN